MSQTAEATETTGRPKKLALHKQLADFLAIPETAMALYHDKFHVEFLTDLEQQTADILSYQYEHIADYGRPATEDVLLLKFPYVEFERPACELEWLIGEFRSRYQRKLAEGVADELARDVRVDPNSAIVSAAKKLSLIQANVRRGAITVTNEDFEEIIGSYRERLNREGVNGITYGFPEVDDQLKGLKKGELAFIIARPKRYKSWMLINSAVAAQKLGHNVTFFTLEMGLPEMFHRYACMATGTSWSRFTSGELLPKEWEQMEKGMQIINDNCPEIKFERPPRGERTIQRLRAVARENKAEIIYIDQLKFLESGRNIGADLRYREIEYVCEELKDLADEFPIYIACQFNREADGMKEMADLSKIGLSDSIGQTADVLLGMYQNREMRQSRIVQMGILDARQYEAVSWDLSVRLGVNSSFKVVDIVEAE